MQIYLKIVRDIFDSISHIQHITDKQVLWTKYLKNQTNADPSGLTFCDVGDKISFHSAGGGGYGNPFERDLDDVRQDLMYQYITAKGAKEDYGVVIDPISLEIDQQATAKLRSAKMA